ncbi:uncharacterized protein ASPGLDRAFT_343100 [Aspergillus glaucus CBS 516.65]|uniref:Uncharacterized protein n=1 Tax=Aspergillus glaucus CBS 516.65 TaxID=1160497 RepID=A0A1L9VIN9_ASPGL|nr:hypothetical protein ASPGLDRAFT_343100 [Aspergillus glaucus CBS 516.65]OJJ83791.1 hypothetical protein ASPGLDRAFT_343100 [Aspergillus glaucus CBS 516.65]
MWVCVLAEELRNLQTTLGIRSSDPIAAISLKTSFFYHKHVLGHEVPQVDIAQEASDNLALCSHSIQNQTQREGQAVHLATGTVSQLRDRSVSENEGQFHPSGRPQTRGGPRAFPLWGGCQGLQPANRHRQTVFACRKFRPPNPGGKRAHHSIRLFDAPLKRSMVVKFCQSHKKR